jgi:hypothetical protein
MASSRGGPEDIRYKIFRQLHFACGVTSLPDSAPPAQEKVAAECVVARAPGPARHARRGGKALGVALLGDVSGPCALCLWDGSRRTRLERSGRGRQGEAGQERDGKFETIVGMELKLRQQVGERDA